jgi:hypothetical protein
MGRLANTVTGFGYYSPLLTYICNKNENRRDLSLIDLAKLYNSPIQLK